MKKWRRPISRLSVPRICLEKPVESRGSRVFRFFCCVSGVLAFFTALAEPVFIQRSAQIPDQTKITGWRKHLVNVKTGHFMFEAPPGKKIEANFSAQQLNIETVKIEGNWLGDPRNATLENATMTGGVRAELTRHSQNPKS